MTNPQRGETAIMIDGAPRTLCLTLGALAEIETALGCDSLKDLSLRLKHVSAHDMMKLLAALLRGGGEKELAGRISELSVRPKDALRAVLNCFGQGQLAVLAGQEAEPHFNVQVMSDQFETLPEDNIRAVNEIYKANPGLSLRLYSSLGDSDEIDLTLMHLLPDLERLEIHYGAPRIKDTTPLKALKKIKFVELEVRQLPSFDFMSDWRNLEHARLIKPSYKGSVKPSLSVLAGLPKLQRLYSLGYAKGLSDLSKCTALTHLSLQDLKLKDLNFSPPQKLTELVLNNVRGPDDLDFHSLEKTTETLKLYRMKPTKPFDPKLSRSDILEANGQSFFYLNLDYLNTYKGKWLNGHSWAGKLEKLCPAYLIKVDPEADGVSYVGTSVDLQTHLLSLDAALAAYFAAKVMP